MTNNKERKITFRVTESEYRELINEASKTSYKKLSSFLRYKAFLQIDASKSAIIGKSLKDELRVFNYEINKIGHNINQISKAIYTNKIDYNSAIIEVKDNLNRIERIVIEINNKR